MFGNQNMKDMMSKLQDMKGAVEDSKKRLENIYVKGDALDGKVRFVLDGNRKLKDLFIDEEVYETMEKKDFIESMKIWSSGLTGSSSFSTSFRASSSLYPFL